MRRTMAIVLGGCLVAGFAASSSAQIGTVEPTQSAVAACIHALSTRYDSQSPGFGLASRPDGLWAELGLATYPQDGAAACAHGFEDKLGDPSLGAPSQPG